jgi:hypothetical protein
LLHIKTVKIHFSFLRFNTAPNVATSGVNLLSINLPISRHHKNNIIITLEQQLLIICAIHSISTGLQPTQIHPKRHLKMTDVNVINQLRSLLSLVHDMERRNAEQRLPDVRIEELARESFGLVLGSKELEEFLNNYIMSMQTCKQG